MARPAHPLFPLLDSFAQSVCWTTQWPFNSQPQCPTSTAGALVTSIQSLPQRKQLTSSIVPVSNTAVSQTLSVFSAVVQQTVGGPESSRATLSPVNPVCLCLCLSSSAQPTLARSTSRHGLFSCSELARGFAAGKKKARTSARRETGSALRT